MVYSVGECHIVLLPPLRPRPLQHSLQIAQGRWRLVIFEQFCLAPACEPFLPSSPFLSELNWRLMTQTVQSQLCDAPSQYNPQKTCMRVFALLPVYTVWTWAWNTVIFLVPAAVECGLQPLLDADDGLLMLHRGSKYFCLYTQTPIRGVGIQTTTVALWQQHRSTESGSVAVIVQTWLYHVWGWWMVWTIDNALCSMLSVASTSAIDQTWNKWPTRTQLSHALQWIIRFIWFACFC